MNYQGYNNAFHVRVGLRCRRPSWRNEEMSTFSARRQPLSRPGHHQVTQRLGSLRCQKLPKLPSNRLQDPANLSPQSSRIPTTMAIPASAASTASSAMSLVLQQGLSAFSLPIRPFGSANKLVQSMENALKLMQTQSGRSHDDADSTSTSVATSFGTFLCSSLVFNFDDKENCLRLQSPTHETNNKDTAPGKSPSKDGLNNEDEKLTAPTDSNKNENSCAFSSFSSLQNMYRTRALRKKAAEEAINLNRGIIRAQNAKYRAVVLAQKKAPVVGFQVQTSLLARNFAESCTPRKQRKLKKANDVNSFHANKENVEENGNKKQHEVAQNRNKNENQLPAPTAATAAAAAAPVSDTADTLEADNVCINSTTPDTSSSVTTTWNKLAQELNCPAIDVVGAMDASWFGTKKTQTKVKRRYSFTPCSIDSIYTQDVTASSNTLTASNTYSLAESCTQSTEATAATTAAENFKNEIQETSSSLLIPSTSTSISTTTTTTCTTSISPTVTNSTAIGTTTATAPQPQPRPQRGVSSGVTTNKASSSLWARCTNKIGSWVKKVTPQQLEFLNEALL